MRRHIITSIFLALICAQMAQGKQATPAKITRAKYGCHQSLSGSWKANQDRRRNGTDFGKLKDDISGCLDLFDPILPKRRIEATSGIKVIDRVSKGR